MALTMPGLAEQALRAFSGPKRKDDQAEHSGASVPKVEVIFLEDTADVKAWLKPFAVTASNITGSHQYAIERRTVAGVVKAVISCKQFAACSDDRLVTVGSLLRETVTGTPVTAQQRPLFFKHACRVPRGVLSDSEHQQVVEYEETRAKNQEVEGLSSLRKNIDSLHDMGLMNNQAHEWWTEFLEKQDNTDWAETAGLVCLRVLTSFDEPAQFIHEPHAM